MLCYNLTSLHRFCGGTTLRTFTSETGNFPLRLGIPTGQLHIFEITTCK